MSLTALAFVGTYFGCLVAAFVRHPIFGLYAYLIAFYGNPQSTWWHSDVPSLRWSLIAAIVTLVSTFRLVRPKSEPSWLSLGVVKLFLLFVAWLWLGTAWALSVDIHLDGVILYAKYLLLIYLIYRVCNSVPLIDDFCFAHVIGCFYLSYLAFGYTGGGRVENIGGAGIEDSNSLGMQLITGIVVAGFLVLRVRGWRRVFLVVSVPFILNGIILTSSRGAILTLAVAGLAAVYLKPPAYRRWVYVSAILGAGLFFYLAHDLLWQRMGTLEALAGERTHQSEGVPEMFIRVEVAKANLAMALDHPFGVGYRGNSILSPLYMDSGLLSAQFGYRSAHNTMLAVLVDQGFPGLFVYALFWFAVARMLIRVRRKALSLERTDVVSICTVIGASLVAVLFAGLFGNFSKAEVQFWFISLLASLYARSIIARD